MSFNSASIAPANASSLSTTSINASNNALLIRLEKARLEDIAEKKLFYTLQQRPLGRQILKSFSEPIEKAVIEIFLEKHCGNQLKTALVLGINRNTLKKKIQNYKLNIQKVLMKDKKLVCLQNRIFISSMSSMDLFFACRAKLLLDNSKNNLPSSNVLKKICQPVERKVIQTVLDYCKGNQIRASQFLGINRNTLKKKLGFKLKEKETVK